MTDSPTRVGRAVNGMPAWAESGKRKAERRQSSVLRLPVRPAVDTIVADTIAVAEDEGEGGAENVKAQVLSSINFHSRATEGAPRGKPVKKKKNEN